MGRQGKRVSDNLSRALDTQGGGKYTRHMKRNELLQRLRKLGSLELKRNGGNHDIYTINGQDLTIPRHNEINEYTAKGILKQAKGATK